MKYDEKLPHYELPLHNHATCSLSKVVVMEKVVCDYVVS